MQMHPFTQPTQSRSSGMIQTQRYSPSNGKFFWLKTFIFFPPRIHSSCRCLQFRFSCLEIIQLHPSTGATFELPPNFTNPTRIARLWSVQNDQVQTPKHPHFRKAGYRTGSWDNTWGTVSPFQIRMLWMVSLLFPCMLPRPNVLLDPGVVGAGGVE